MDIKNLKEKTQIVVIAGIILVSYVFILFKLDVVTKTINDISLLFVPFVWGFVIAYLINPLVKKIKILWEKILKRECKNGVALIIAYIIVLVLLFFIMASVIPQLLASINMILLKIPENINGAIKWLKTDGEIYLSEITHSQIKVDDFISVLTANITPMLENLTSSLTKAASATVEIAKFLTNIILGIIISIYMMMHKDTYVAQIRKSVIALLPENKSTKFLSFWDTVNSTFSRFINAKVVDSLIIGVLCYFGCLILRFENAFLISFIIGITNIVPYFGPFIGAIPASLIVLMQSPLDMFFFIIFIFALQQFDGNILGPKLLGDSLGLTSLWIIFAVIIMTGIFGVVGMIVGVPLFAIIYMLFKSIVYEKLRKKGLSTNTEDYIKE